MNASRVVWRIFLDTGVIMDGCVSAWSAAKAVLILATHLRGLSIVLADVVDEEMRAIFARKASESATAAVEAAYQGWLTRVRLERWPRPTEQAIRGWMPIVLPALRHINDLPVVVSALEARPDWVLSTNTAHWGSALETRTSLRIATPHRFLERLAIDRS